MIKFLSQIAIVFITINSLYSQSYYDVIWQYLKDENKTFVYENTKCIEYSSSYFTRILNDYFQLKLEKCKIRSLTTNNLTLESSLINFVDEAKIEMLQIENLQLEDSLLKYQEINCIDSDIVSKLKCLQQDEIYLNLKKKVLESKNKLVYVSLPHRINRKYVLIFEWTTTTNVKSINHSTIKAYLFNYKTRKLINRVFIG